VEKDCWFNRTAGVWIGRMDVHSDAIIYNHTTHSWQTVGTGQKACVKVIVNYKFGNWHHGIPMDMSDVLASIGFYWDWAYNDTETFDVGYHPYIEDYYADTMAMIKGIRILNETAMEVYHDYVFIIDDNVTAAFGVFWPTVPWEVRTVMEYCVVNGGPATGKTYDWSEDYSAFGREEWVDMINPMHVLDFERAAEMINSTQATGWFMPSYVVLTGTPYAGYTPSTDDCIARWEALMDWIDEYGHICVSNGPYYMEEWDPVKRYMVMKAFRDPTYPFTPDEMATMVPEDYRVQPAKVAPPPPPPPPPRRLLWVGVGVGVAVVIIIAAAASFMLRKRG
ncbi:hypothetical protein DRO32_01790, partial [Candidatus Bathyarchaeota archaeon]